MKSFAVTLADNTNMLIVANSFSDCVSFLGSKADEVIQIQPIKAETYVVGCSDSL